MLIVIPRWLPLQDIVFTSDQLVLFITRWMIQALESLWFYNLFFCWVLHVFTAVWKPQAFTNFFWPVKITLKISWVFNQNSFKFPFGLASIVKTMLIYRWKSFIYLNYLWMNCFLNFVYNIVFFYLYISERSRLNPDVLEGGGIELNLS